MQAFSAADIEALHKRFTAAVEQGLCTGTQTMRLHANHPPWQTSALRLKRGDSYSVFASGIIAWSKRYRHLHGGPRFHLWTRVSSGGRAVNVATDSGSFTADRDGRLEFAIYMGMWADEYGNLASSTDLYAPLEGYLDVTAVTFKNAPIVALQSLHDSGPAQASIDAELIRLRRNYEPPSGWHYLHECGYSEIYRDEDSANARVIEARASDDQGILRRTIDFPLTEDTRLQWRWRVAQHPSLEAENRAASHDYISVAAEFDNGRDLTWIWSSCLPKGTHFACPVKVWCERETHYVIRSEEDMLNHWYEESRNVYEDVRESMGAPPTRITAIWLIMLSTFHHRVAEADFSDIVVFDETNSLCVL